MRRIALAVAAVALATTATSGLDLSPAAAGGPGEPIVKVSKHADGPFKPSLGKIRIPVGARKTVYFKVKTEVPGGVGTLAVQLTGTPDDPFEDRYRVKWFRNTKNVTDKITSMQGLSVNIDPDEAKRYEARIRHLTDVDPGICLELSAFVESAGTTDFATIGVDGPCN